VCPWAASTYQPPGPTTGIRGWSRPAAIRSSRQS
jgi:hypothetical protein